MPAEKIRVLIVDDIAETRENLRKLLSFAPDIEVVGTAATGEEGVQMARELVPHVVIMDINLPGMDGITATEQIAREVPTTQIIILSVQGETGYMRRAMAAGARDFLVKPPSGDELMATIRRVYEIGQVQAARIAPAPTVTAPGAVGRPAVRHGQLIVVFSPKGGAGCTTIAVNLAVALQTRLGMSQKVAIMDGSFQFGDVGVMLNLQPARTIADLAVRVEELDSDLLTSVLTPHASGIKALLAPPHPEAADAVIGADGGMTESSRRIGIILDGLLREFDLVVVDTWSLLNELTLTFMDRADLILLVITPLIPDIKDARHFLDLADRLGYPREKLGLVINQADRKTGLRLDQIERALIPALAHIPYDERAGIIAANRGLPIATEEASKPIGQAFVQLAAGVLERLSELRKTEEEEEAVSVEVSRRLLGRALGI
ncbi:MAG: response regulator [Anaerolineae bacterium]|nr:response regulator [Anaerolineae bacterium]MDW8067340.1 response regulator [Anaerolineae bacterium]